MRSDRGCSSPIGSAAVSALAGASHSGSVAAGAAASVMGAYLVLLPRSRVMVLVPVWKALDLVDVPAVVVILCWLALHVMRHAGTIAAPAPLTGAVIVPLAGLAAGSIAGRLLGRGTVSRNW